MLVIMPLMILGLFSISARENYDIDSMVVFFVSLMLFLDILYFAALVDKLRIVAIILFISFLSITIYILAKKCKERKLYTIFKNCNVYFGLFNISCVVFSLIFSVKKPALYYWDELNIWGPSAKAVKLFDRLYSIGINPSTNDRNYPPGNAILNYFFSFFDSDYSEYVLLISYAFLFLACFALVASVIYKLTKNHTVAIGSYFVMLLSPFIAANHLPKADYSSISYAYGTTMVDFNLAVVFIAVIALYFGERNRKWFLLPLIYLITIKKNGIFFALLAICVIGCYEFFVFKEKGWKLKKAVVTCLSAIVAIGLAYGAWTVHLDYYELPKQEKIFNLKDAQPKTEVKQAVDAEKTEEISELPAKKRVKPRETSIKAIFIPSLRTERYNEILDEMKWYFINNKEIVFCTDIVLIGFLFVLGIVAAIRGKKEWRIAALFTVFGITAGCFVYNLVIAYQMQFYNDMMVEYPRYMLSYYFSWIYLVMFMFLTSEKIRDSVKNMLITTVLTVSLVYVYGTGLDYTVIDRPQNPASWAKSVTEQTKKVNMVLEKGDRVYLVYPDQDGETYIAYRYNLQPAYAGIDTLSTGIDFSINFREKIDYTSDRQYYNVASPQKFTDVMNTYFDYIYVIQPDEEFYTSYSELFSDGMTTGTLYKVTTGEIPMQAVIL